MPRAADPKKPGRRDRAVSARRAPPGAVRVERCLVATKAREDPFVVLGEDFGQATAVRLVGVSATTTAWESRRAHRGHDASVSAPARSVLLRKIRVGTPTCWRARNSSGVCGWTPSTAETTSTAPSSTPRTRSTSAMKSGWPGVSTRLTWRSPTWNDATAERMVIPRSRSSSSESVWVVPASTLPTRSIAPAAKRSRSVRVVLPASTWARMPRLSVRMGPHVVQGGSHRLADMGAPISLLSLAGLASFGCRRSVARRVGGARKVVDARSARLRPARPVLHWVIIRDLPALVGSSLGCVCARLDQCRRDQGLRPTTLCSSRTSSTPPWALACPFVASEHLAH